MNYAETNKRVKEFIDSVVGREFTFIEFDKIMSEQGFESIVPENVEKMKGNDERNFMMETMDNTMVYRMPESVYKDNMYDFETTFPIKVFVRFKIIEIPHRISQPLYWESTMIVKYMSTIY